MFAGYHPGAPSTLRPQALTAGDRVALIAPASPFDRERFERGAKALQAIGLEPAFGEGIYSKHPEQDPYLAGTDERRLSELRSALQDPAVRMITLARGGYGLMRLLHAPNPLELGELVTAQKLLLGYSDATVLHELWARAGLPSIHGPMCTQLGEDVPALERLRELVQGKDPGPVRWEPRAPIESTLVRTGTAEGVLRGGNLAMLAALCGTPLMPQFSGCIVLLEDLNEPPYRLDRLVTQLLLAGVLRGARAVVVGDLVGAGEPSKGRAEAVAERLSTLNIPLAFGAPFGHAGRNEPVAFGCRHALDVAQGTLTPLESPVSVRTAQNA
ncbi:MAG: LD-carboxypeptidase [Deltaproteobacteria bacterium]|nr:LD-carboxypeptidase [Deltaproteobacteria bacterium]